MDFVGNVHFNINTENVGSRIRFSTGSSNDAIKIKTNYASLEHRFFFTGIGADSRTIIFNLYCRASNGLIKIENLGEVSVQAHWHGSEANTIVVTTGQYCSGTMISHQTSDTFSVAYSTSGKSLVKNDISGIGDGSVLGAISALNTETIRWVAHHDLTILDFNDFPDRMIIWGNNQWTSNKPPENTNAWHVLTVYTVHYTHGFQLAISYDGRHVYERTIADGTWNAWYKLAFQ